MIYNGIIFKDATAFLYIKIDRMIVSEKEIYLAFYTFYDDAILYSSYT